MPDPSFIQRLKERKLVQWAVAYLAGAWVIYEVTATVGSSWGITDGFLQGLFVILAMGFFITLVLAWYHGEKGRQRVSGPELLMVAALLVVAGVALTLLRSKEEGVSRVAFDGDDRPGIAVFPCENWSPDPEDAFFARGIHDEILLRLSAISGLRSIGRETMEWYNERSLPTRQVAQELGVGYLGECSALKDSDRNQIRLTFQLIDGNSGTQIWAESYDEDLTARSFFEIHTKVARRVAQAVGTFLTPEEEGRVEAQPTGNLEAFNDFSTGRVWLERRGNQGVEALQQAVEYFDRAIAKDSLYALAYAGRAAAYALSSSYGTFVPWEVASSRAETAIRTALGIDPHLAEAHAALAFLRLRQLRWEEAEAECQAAIGLNPGYATAHQWYGFLLATQGRSEEAIEELRTALKLEPLSPIINEDLGDMLYFAREHQEAVDQYLKTLSLFPDRVGTHMMLGMTLLQLGQFEEAKDHFMVGMGDPGGPPITHQATSVTRAFVSLGDHESAQSLLEDSEEWSPRARLRAYAGVEDLERTFALVDTTLTLHSGSGISIIRDPFYDFLKGDPRYGIFVRRMGLERWRPLGLDSGGGGYLKTPIPTSTPSGKSTGIMQETDLLDGVAILMKCLLK